jgi:endoglucanase
MRSGEPAPPNRSWPEHKPFDPAGQLAASIHAYGVLGNFEKNIGVVAERVPVVMTEIGEKDCADTALEKLLPWADAHGVSYLAWAWYTGDCARGPSLISNYDGTPTPYGIGFREHLVGNFPPPSPISG